MVSGGCAKPPYTVFTGVIINAASRVGRYGVLDGGKRVQITVPTVHETKPSRFPPKTKSIITRVPRSMSSSSVESLKTIKKKKETVFAKSASLMANAKRSCGYVVHHTRGHTLMLTILFFLRYTFNVIHVTHTTGKRLFEIVNIYDERARNVKG